MLQKKIKIIKITLAVIIISIIVLACDIHSVTSIGVLSDCLETAYRFINEQSKFFFIAIGALFFFYNIADLYKVYEKREKEKSLAVKIKEYQKTSCACINERCNKIEDKLYDFNHQFEKDSSAIKLTTVKHQNKMRITLKNMESVYDHNSQAYYGTNKEIYHIVSSTQLYLNKDVKLLVDEYQKL